MLIVALLLVLLVLGLNVVATVVIVRRDGLSAGGRTVQLLLVWLLPLVGAILCMAVATADGSGIRGDNSFGGGYDHPGGQSGDSYSHQSHSSSDCSSDGGSGDGGSCGSCAGRQPHPLNRRLRSARALARSTTRPLPHRRPMPGPG